MEKKATIMYKLTEEGRKASLLAGGDGKEQQEIQVDITPELLELAFVGTDGEVVLDLTRNRPNTAELRTGYNAGIDLRCVFKNLNWNSTGAEEFDTPQTAEQLIAWEQNRRASLQAQVTELEPLVEAAKIEYEKEKAAKDARIAVEEKERKERLAAQEAAEKAKKEAALKDRADWIARHGSDYLKRATALDYNCQRQYVTERTALEYPDYTIDFDDYAEWNDRACPSAKALAEVEKLVAASISAKVVWLTHPARPWESDDDGYPVEEWDPREAIVIQNYLSKYVLVKEM